MKCGLSHAEFTSSSWSEQTSEEKPKESSTKSSICIASTLSEDVRNIVMKELTMETVPALHEGEETKKKF